MGKINPIAVAFSNDTEALRRLLWKELQIRFEPFCATNESCWLDNIELSSCLQKDPEMFTAINYFTLKPKGTVGKHDWLSNMEIDYVMHQYAIAFPFFKYIGCFPSDHYKLHKFPCHLLDTEGCYAVIFNLDETNQPGSHWVAVFMERFEDGSLLVEFFDPTGDKPIKNIRQFLELPCFDGAIKIINKKAHQKGNNECGVYSIFYVLSRLEGYTMEEINQRRIPDRVMNEYRKNLFRPRTEEFKYEY